jgi:tetratricopeptide (TPR) repeat protein
MKCRLLPLLGILFVAVGPRALRADQLFYDGLTYSDVTINGYHGDGVLVTLKSGQQVMSLAKISWMALDAAPAFVEAERARVSAPKKAAALYKEAIHALNDPDQKRLAELRAIAPTDADGRYVEALADFLDVYAANPNEATWPLHPTHLPGAGSTMLLEAADQIQKALPNFSSDEAKGHLLRMQLELYTKAGDPRADTLVKQLTTGIVESSTPKTASSLIEEGAIGPIQEAIKAKDFASAIQQADALIRVAGEDTAIRAYELKALAYQGENQLDAAASTLLHIMTYYPASTSAPTALLMAADLQKRSGHSPEAQRLYHEIVEKYPTSPEAIKASGQ